MLVEHEDYVTSDKCSREAYDITLMFSFFFQKFKILPQKYASSKHFFKAVQIIYFF